jgi:hypothetical protein
MRGDVNNDGVVNVLDAVQVLRSLVGLESCVATSTIATRFFPFNSEDMLGYNAARSVYSRGCRATIMDAIHILRYISGLPSALDECPPNCDRDFCKRPGRPPACEDLRCRQCSLISCVCIGTLRVEIDARSNVIRYFHDSPLESGSDLDFSFAIEGAGITIDTPVHTMKIDHGLEIKLLDGLMENTLSSDVFVIFAAIMTRDLPPGAYIAMQSFEGSAENIVFAPHPDAPLHNYPIGNVLLIQ